MSSRSPNLQRRGGPLVKRAGIFVVAALLAACTGSAAHAAERKPNILVIVADDKYDHDVSKPRQCPEYAGFCAEYEPSLEYGEPR